MRRRGSRPHIDAVPDVRASTGFQHSSQTPMRQPEIDNEPIPQCGTRYNARRRGAFEVTSMIRRMSRISAMLVGRIARQEDSPSGLWRTLGKRVGCKPSGVRIPHPPQASGDGLPRRTESRHFPLSHNEKSMFGRRPKIPQESAAYRLALTRRDTFGESSRRKKGVFARRRWPHRCSSLPYSQTQFLGVCRRYLS